MSVKSKNSFVLLLLLAMIAFVLLYDVDFFTSSKQLPVTIIKNKNCLYEDNSCDIETDEFNLKLILDKNISYLKPFKIIATTENINQINKIQLTFNMVGMDMGINRFILNKENKVTEFQKWVGSGIIPICVSGRADWVVDADIFTNRNHYRMSFTVVVKKNK